MEEEEQCSVLVSVIKADEQNRSDFVLLLESVKLLFIRSCDQTDARHLEALY